jgi:hypothetical protein
LSIRKVGCRHLFVDSPNREQVSPPRPDKPAFLQVSMRSDLLTAVEQVR